MIYNKLVRDRIPAMIEQNGQTPGIHIADDDEYQRLLIAKLKEESEEFAESEAIEELADILEVIHAICAFHNVDLADLEAIRQRKAAERGGFAGRVVLEQVI